jgi:hypothetical protein
MLLYVTSVSLKHGLKSFIALQLLKLNHCLSSALKIHDCLLQATPLSTSGFVIFTFLWCWVIGKWMRGHNNTFVVIKGLSLWLKFNQKVTKLYRYQSYVLGVIRVKVWRHQWMQMVKGLTYSLRKMLLKYSPSGWVEQTSLNSNQ